MQEIPIIQDGKQELQVILSYVKRNNGQNVHSEDVAVGILPISHVFVHKADAQTNRGNHKETTSTLY